MDWRRSEWWWQRLRWASGLPEAGRPHSSRPIPLTRPGWRIQISRDGPSLVPNGRSDGFVTRLVGDGDSAAFAPGGDRRMEELHVALRRARPGHVLGHGALDEPRPQLRVAVRFGRPHDRRIELPR